MGYADLIATQIQTYRNSILFNINDDQPLVNVGLVKVYFDILPSYLRVNGLTLTPEPTKPIMDFETAFEERAGKFSSQYANEQIEWVLDNLKLIEQSYATHLYHRHKLFEVLQVAVQSYRQTILFQLQKDRAIFFTMRLIEIMNVLLPESFRAKLPDKPDPEGMFSSELETKNLEWALSALNGVESATSRYVSTVISASMH
jgi:hypothetical protein